MRQKYCLAGFRYFLMREMHFGHDGSFTEPALVNRFNADLANDLGNLFNRSLAMTHKYFQGQVPQSGAWNSEDKALVELGNKALRDYIAHFQAFQVAQALESFWEFVRGVNRYIDSMAPWALKKVGEEERLQTVMALVLASLRRICLAIWPVMPDAGTALLAQIGQDFDPKAVDLQLETQVWTLVQAGTQVAKKSNMFPRQEMTGEPENKAASQSSAASASEPKAGTADIEFADFQKMDLRVGTITQAEAVPKADKLLKLLVDLGDQEPRQIVAGLAQSFAPEDLMGRQVVVVANLKPRKMRGVLSQGMVLAVHDAQTLRLLVPDRQVQAGSKVS